MRKSKLLTAVLTLFLSVPASITWAQTISSQKGLTTAVFQTQNGSIKVYLPEVIRPGETFSVTILAEPIGKNSKQLEKNLVELGNYNVKIDGYSIDDKQGWSGQIQKNRQGAVQLELFNVKGNKESEIPIQLSKAGGNPAVESGCTIPSHALIGSPLRITGPFDGDASNTKCSLDGKELQVLAESKGQCIISYSTDATGITSLNVQEKEKQLCTQQISSVLLDVSTGKLNLSKGEKTFIDVSITGLQNLPDTAILSLKNMTTGIVAMLPMNTVIIPIFPDSVGSGNFNKRFDMQSLKTGSFEVNVDLDLPEPVNLYDEQPGNNIGNNKQDSIPCQPTEEDIKKAENAIKDLERELAGIDELLDAANKKNEDCKDALEVALKEYYKAKAEFDKQKEQKRFFEIAKREMTAKAKKKYDDAQDNYDNALKKWQEQNEKCKKLEEELKKLKKRKESLPGLINDAAAAAEKTKAEAEKCKQKEEEEKKKKKEEEEKKRKTGSQPGDNNDGAKPGNETVDLAGKPCKPEGLQKKTNERVYEPCEVEETIITPCNVSEFQSEVFDKIKDLLNMIKKLKDPIELAEKIAKVSSLSKAICINVHIIRKWRDIEYTWECINGKWVEMNKKTKNGVDKYGSFQVMDGSLQCCWVFDGSKAMESEVANKIKERLDQCK